MECPDCGCSDFSYRKTFFRTHRYAEFMPDGTVRADVSFTDEPTDEMGWVECDTCGREIELIDHDTVTYHVA